jgi:hypothetical protein
MDINQLIEEISQLPPDWHKVGSVSTFALEAIVKHAETLGDIDYTMETGSGKTTLLFSHLSKHHLVFAYDGGSGSITQVQDSPLFKRETTHFIEGSTQRTLPNYSFEKKLKIALIDGPHAYPFPDLEYYYIYQHLEIGGLLLLDDIQILSIGRMFEILKYDDMFELLEVVDNNLAFFRRTTAPLFEPFEDNWWLQRYNTRLSENGKENASYTGFVKQALIPKISELPSDWYKAGSVSTIALETIVKHAETIGDIDYTMETGCGKTTFLFSHLSKHHLVFADDGGSGSIAQAEELYILKRGTTHFIEGPTQKTLPNYSFEKKLKIALIDGSHAPDLEYYYIYENLEKGGLLLLDDIQILSIGRMFKLLKRDHRFELLEVLDNNLAFFRRKTGKKNSSYTTVLKGLIPHKVKQLIKGR